MPQVRARDEHLAVAIGRPHAPRKRRVEGFLLVESPAVSDQERVTNAIVSLRNASATGGIKSAN